ncbi:hypothetical protein [Rhodococcus sp. IEGM 1330]|uniref:phage major capsid protein n=1 Tax=Rhodococcus sp. IEGM 1330 TaxID=3082225 RepID=UPI002953A9FE|nr:hypothetical protein [Rhodococcus sp. IEGM 1330]MDV8022007.1 hypothetical protein [Rhodococcus sp. IEGM 1330]
MPITYPAGPPVISGDLQTISRYLGTPSVVAKRVNEIAKQRFISDRILMGRTDVNGGSVIIEQDDPMFTTREPEAISPGGEYPLANVNNGTAVAVKVVKWGQDVPITDEQIKRSNFSPVERAQQTLVNTLVRTVDSLSLSLVASVVTQTQPVSNGQWSSSTKILLDLMLAKAKIRKLNKGYDPDLLVVDDDTWAYLAADPNLALQRAREDTTNPVYSGEFFTLAGLTILPTPNLPAPGVWVIDSNALGGIADEKLGEGYTGDVVETKSIRDDDNDQWRIRARRVCVPYVNAPDAAIKITGATAAG